MAFLRGNHPYVDFDHNNATTGRLFFDVFVAGTIDGSSVPHHN
jgi:hypothetical protein